MEKASEAERVEIGRRIKAARAYAGFRSPERLAEEIGEPGYGRDAIITWEQGRYTRPLGRTKLQRLATACGLPQWFLYIDFPGLSELVDEDEERTLSRWLRRSDSPTEEEGPGSQSSGGE